MSRHWSYLGEQNVLTCYSEAVPETIVEATWAGFNDSTSAITPAQNHSPESDAESASETPLASEPEEILLLKGTCEGSPRSQHSQFTL